MPQITRPKRKTTARTSKQSNKTKFKFRWWMGLIIITVVALVGVVVVRFSRAAEPGSVSAAYVGYDGQNDIYQQYASGNKLPPKKYRRISGNTFGTIDTGSYAARCYRITNGKTYGNVVMTEIPTEYCGWLWYSNRPTLQWPTDFGAMTQCWGNNALTGFNVTNPSWAGGGAHPGIDLGVGIGTEIKAVDNGYIVGNYESNQTNGYGRLTVIKLDNGLYAGYAHLNDFNDAGGKVLPPGTRVGKNWVIGHTGNTPGGGVPAHLHFFISTVPISAFKGFDGTNLNPLNYFTDNGWHNVGQCVRT